MNVYEALCKLSPCTNTKSIIAFESEIERHELSKESEHPQTRNNDGF